MRFGIENMDVENRMKSSDTQPLPTLKDIIGEEKLEQKIEEQKDLNNNNSVIVF